MSHHSHLLADVRKAARAPRESQSFFLSKAELWERLQAAELAVAKFQRVATMAHDFAQAESGEARRKLFAVRDAIYGARGAGEQRGQRVEHEASGRVDCRHE